ncbi:MAG: urease accessory protein UreD [Aestuariivita sp.]|nr:urease accessory protein UreD [Aestuariivita sp.]MCY4202888.1 urease accessory protein UreD [Aestuariivita sp.]MCY4289963.1 urease accessory protein UreD [Aestuariivita sp.]MCY4346798.1 urease accessory protein UreD [Aestuariivita sp.]
MENETRLQSVPNTPENTSLPRAKGEVRLSTKLHSNKTVICKLRQSGSLRCLFPRTDQRQLQAVLLNCAGGMTGGDRYDLNAEVKEGTTLTISTQAAEKIYRAPYGQSAQVNSHIRVEQHAHLYWLPQETILFEDSALERSLNIRIAKTSTLLLTESLVFGRLEMGESIRSSRLSDRVDIRRGGVPLFLDIVKFSGDVASQLDRLAVASSARVVTSLLYVGRDAALRQPRLLELLPKKAGISQLEEEVLVLRMLSQDTNLMRSTLIPILDFLSNKSLPQCWNL